jgi:hypothetical protein
MRERIAACLICLVAMLTWEALSASSREAVRIPKDAVEVGPLVQLSEGIVGAKPSVAPELFASGDDAADAAVLEWVEELLPVVAQPCEPVVIAACDGRPKRTAKNVAPGEHDAGVGASASSRAGAAPSGKRG